MNSLWYKKPAQNIKEAFPVGNGRLGALVHGNIGHEVIDLNEESVWSKPYTNRNNTSAASSLKDVRNLIELNRIPEAQELIYESFTALPQKPAHYKSAGALHIDYYDGETYGLKGPDGVRRNLDESVSFYKRQLDFETALATTVFTRESKTPSTEDLSKNTNGSSITYTTEVFASLQDDLLAVHISASTPKSIYLRVYLECQDAYKKYALSNDTVCFHSINGVPFAAMVMAVAVDGNVKTVGSNIIIEKADEVTLYVDVESAFRKSHYFKKNGDVHRKCDSLALWSADRALKKLCLAANRNYDSIKTLHLQESLAQFKRVSFNLTDGSSKLSAEELMENKSSLDFMETFWNFSRYLLASSSMNPGSLPPLKCGLWLTESENAEDVRYSLANIPAEIFSTYATGLKRNGLSVKTLYKKLYLHGRVTAREMYGQQGCVLHSLTDLWGDTCPAGSDLRTSYSILSGTTMVDAVMNQYYSTMNVKFLKKEYGFLNDIARFYAALLTVENDGKTASLIPSFGEYKKDGETFYAGVSGAKENYALYKMFEKVIKAGEICSISSFDEDQILFKAMKKRLEKSALEYDEAAVEKAEASDFKFEPESFLDRNFEILYTTTQRIISSRVKDDKLEISLLEDIPECIASGEFKGASLKGNVYANITWKDGRIKAAKLYSKPGHDFIDQLVICYKGKRYNASLKNNTLDVMNVLPTTV
ncbi:glycoside hydrolase family 95 protein [Treponema sp.]|uniref:glycoside hydrolase family 95 protein n=1 Tax=Treponema sp. TaxID=166 RepID=UPI0025E42886|nr:glycoside hydrolase family 95 protein [Treponema sp.]MCR5217797.1 glycoside hydrolase family 95 protein [Treponema sp.]